jgi:hypothetical protein
MKTYGGVEIELHLSSPRQLHYPAALPSEKEPPVPTGYEAEWAAESVWTLWRKVKLMLTGIEPGPYST